MTALAPQPGDRGEVQVIFPDGPRMMPATGVMIWHPGCPRLAIDVPLQTPGYITFRHNDQFVTVPL